MIIKIKHYDYPGESTGQWNDSTLKLYLRGNKEKVQRVLDSIKKTLGDCHETGG